MAEAGDQKEMLPPKQDGDSPEEEVNPLPVKPDTTSTSQWLAGLMKRQMGLVDKEDRPEQRLEEITIDGVVKYIKSGKCKNIIVMAGAGISTSAGIPDFRSPGTGLYDNLQKYNLPSPHAIFDINYFRENPEPFFALAKDLYPGFFKPTPCHYFIRMLHEKGLLLRHYTQNIDTLERVAGLDGEKIMEAHGTFHTSHCLDCGKKYDLEWMKSKLFTETVPKCYVEDCGGTVKPDIVFFGEALPSQFAHLSLSDMPKCDLLIVMGTSLVVQPFASLANRVPDTAPRLYLNLEKTEGQGDPMMALLGMGHDFKFDAEDNYRDVFFQGDCDSSCLYLAEKLGWKEELEKLVDTENKKVGEKIAAEKAMAAGAANRGSKEDKSNNAGETTGTGDTEKKSDDTLKSPKEGSNI